MILRSILSGLLLTGLVVLDKSPSDAQERVRVDGWVQWVAGSSMQLMTGGGTVAVDLRQADQALYRGLRTGERVIVDGTVSRDRRAVVAQLIWRVDDTQSP
jgi:hypothetical protein